MLSPTGLQVIFFEDDETHTTLSGLQIASIPKSAAAL
jgi:hypothetical protein